MEQKAKKKFRVPHILLILLFIILLVSLLSYIMPAGVYQMDENGRAIPGTFTYVENSPVSPWQALLKISAGVQSAAGTIALLLVSAGAITVVISTGAFEEIINFGIYKLQEKSVSILIPCIVVLMSLLGAFAGNDSMFTFVAVGLIICKRLRLDRITAMAMFYLGYLIGMGSSFTNNMVITFQSMVGVTPLSGIGVRIAVWVLFTAINAIYCTRYAKKVSKDPSKSILNEVLSPDDDMEELTEVGFPVRGVIALISMMLSYTIYAVCAQKYGWGTNYLMAIMVINAIFTVLVYRMNPNDASASFLKGAQSMGGIALVMGLARVIGSMLTESNIVYTIANGASNVIGHIGLAFAGIAIFVFTLLFNLLIPSGLSKAAIILPVLTPIGDVCGITRQVIAITYQYGDSLSNTLTPLSGPLLGALGLAGVDYAKWIRYSLPLMGILAACAAVIIAALTTVQWTG